MLKKEKEKRRKKGVERKKKEKRRKKGFERKKRRNLNGERGWLRERREKEK